MTNLKNKGWVRVYRQSLTSSVWQKPFIWMVWSWCLLKSNHKNVKFPFNGTDIELNAGQFITGINKAVEEIPTSTPQKLRTAFNYLKSTNRITIKTTNKFSIITILNWLEYQNDIIDNKQNNKQVNKPITNQQQTNNKPITTYNNDKNEKNEKKDTNTLQNDILHKQIVFLINEFKRINPTINFGHKTHRKSCKELIKQFGYEEVCNLVKVAIEVQGEKYSPMITTPTQLKNKMGELGVFIKKSSKSRIAIIKV